MSHFAAPAESLVKDEQSGEKVGEQSGQRLRLYPRTPFDGIIAHLLHTVSFIVALTTRSAMLFFYYSSGDS